MLSINLALLIFPFPKEAFPTFNHCQVGDWILFHFPLLEELGIHRGKKITLSTSPNHTTYEPEAG